MTYTIPIIDIFAGPGGLNEGFSRLGEDQGKPVFSAVASFEMESSACKTLRLRGTYRNLARAGQLPNIYYDFLNGGVSFDDLLGNAAVKEAWESANSHVYEIELGPESRQKSNAIIEARLRDVGIIRQDDPWALIGGPPCQAYSLAGRSRRAKDVDFEKDKKHFLYEEYLEILRTFRPPVFVMENVKGLLSSTNGGARMFDRILGDLAHPNAEVDYDIYSLVSDRGPGELESRDFIIKAEEYGIPQRRHRVILLGIRKGFVASGKTPNNLSKSLPKTTVADALTGMPQLRSGLSRGLDNVARWLDVRRNAALSAGYAPAARDAELTRGSLSQPRTADVSGRLGEWLLDPNFGNVVQHESRSHMPKDLERYWFAATKTAETGRSPKLSEFPSSLLPDHKNANDISHPFEDRFRVQVKGEPSTTIVSHIAKDGHYYIHHDPDQMRSLTVREAARLQTFPDNYYFMGNRTQQYHQVGNAVPPLLANQIAEVVASLFDR